MDNDFTRTPRGFEARASIRIDAVPEKVWRALTDPAMIRQYLFGTTVKTTWRVGDPITWTGEWQGKSYEDKGKILDFIPNRLLRSTYWSSMSSRPDVPESYNTVTYELVEKDGRTTLTISQDNNATQESAEHSRANWETVLQSMKKLLEKKG